MEAAVVKCEKCDGTGRTVFTHVEAGVCFRCNGTGEAEASARKTVAARRFDFDRATALKILRRVYRNAVKHGDTMNDASEGAYLGEVLAALEVAPEARAHLAALPGWEGVAA
jgi:DnaJ-class molecular chaperone